jgi:hypothetical protein
MSFALAPQSRNKEARNKTSTTPVKRSSQGGGVSRMAMTSHDSIIHLQKTIGNQAVQRLLRSKASDDAMMTGIQTKLKVSQPGDVYEQEADRVADQIMRMSAPSHIGLAASNKEERIDRKCSACEMKKEREEEENLQISRKPSTTSNFEANNESTNGINNVRSSCGSSLDNDTRKMMESRLGYDFGRVRIHNDAKAAESAQSVNALAYTLGENIVFGEGQYSPSSTSGRRLLAHELVHVIQQNTRVPSGMIQRQSHEPPVHPSGSNATLREGIPSEKWSEILENQYRRRGDSRRANAIRKCREQGRAACAYLLTNREMWALYSLGKASKGDPKKVEEGLGKAAPLLAYLGPLPALRGAAAGAAEVAGAAGAGTAAAVAGVAFVAALIVMEVISLMELAEFQAKLEEQGFIILEDPLAVCIGGCHMPPASQLSTPELSPFPTFPSGPLSGKELEDLRKWTESQKTPQEDQKKSPRTMPDVEPETREKEKEKKDHGGSIQAQGTDIMTNVRGNEGTESESWRQPIPLTLSAGRAKMAMLFNKLSYNQRGVRRTAFVHASAFMTRVSAGGGTGPISKSYPRDGPKGETEVAQLPHPSIRVDIVVYTGRAFVPG